MTLLDTVDSELTQRGIDPEAVGAALGRNPRTRNARLGAQVPTGDFLLPNMNGGRYSLETPEAARGRLGGSALQSPLGQNRMLAPATESGATSAAPAPRSAVTVSPILGSVRTGQTTNFEDAQPNVTLGNEPKPPVQPLGLAERYKTLEAQRPEKSQFQEHVGLGKKILGTLATIGAGWYGASTHDPTLAPRVANHFFHPQFNQAMDEYNAQLGDVANEAKLGQTEADTRLANARATDLLNPKPATEKPENLDREAYDFYIGQGMTPAEARKRVLQDAQSVKPDRQTHSNPFEAFAYGTPEEKKAAQDYLEFEKKLGAHYRTPSEFDERYRLFKQDPETYKAMFGDKSATKPDTATATRMLTYFANRRKEVQQDFTLSDEEKAQKLQEIGNLEQPFMAAVQPGAGKAGDRVEVISPNGQRGTIPRAQLDTAQKKGYRLAQ